MAVRCWPLAGGDGFSGSSEVAASASFYFNEHKFLALTSDDVHLAPTAAIFGGQQSLTPGLRVQPSLVFSPLPQTAAGRGYGDAGRLNSPLNTVGERHARLRYRREGAAVNLTGPQCA